MQRTAKIYGALPADLGLVDLSPVEMMCWLYCPIKLPGMMSLSLPDNLAQFRGLVASVSLDAIDVWVDSFVYLTAKTLWVSPENPGNRPGWHSDGFLTDDLNYIWSDTNPTVFFHDGYRHRFTADHAASLPEMDALCEQSASTKTFPDKHLLRLDQTVLHKVGPVNKAGMRTFIKISVSRHRYALRGNSINHELATDWAYQDRLETRNCPIGRDQ